MAECKSYFLNIRKRIIAPMIKPLVPIFEIVSDILEPLRKASPEFAGSNLNAKLSGSNGFLFEVGNKSGIVKLPIFPPASIDIYYERSGVI